MTTTVLSIDVGGTKIAVAAIDETGAVLAEVQEPTIVDGESAGRHQLERLLAQVATGLTPAPSAVGMAIPAVLEQGSDLVIWSPNLPGWNGLRLREILNELCDLPAVVEYDGHASAIGEGWLGGAVGATDFVCVAIGTGIGCGVVANGSLVRGLSRVAGAAGWFLMGANDASWEAMAAGPAIRTMARNKIAEGAVTALSDAPDPDAADVFAAARSGDLVATQILDEVAAIVGRGVSNLVSVLNPDIVVLGGSIGSQPELLPGIRAVIDTTAQPYAAAAVRVVNSPLGSRSVIFGAARSALDLLEKAKTFEKEGASS